jgi:maltose/moltooligosaccharide transporter
LLGSVPAAVVKNAVCDVLVVQTSALDEDRLFGGRGADVAGSVPGGDPEGRPPAR